MKDMDAIKKFNERRNQRIRKAVNIDWGFTQNEYEGMIPTAQSRAMNFTSATNAEIKKKERAAFEELLNALRKSGNFSRMYDALETAPVGCAVSFDGDDWVKRENSWTPQNVKPARTHELANKLLTSGSKIEYAEDGFKKVEKKTNDALKGLVKAGAKAAVSKLLDSKTEGSELELDGIRYRKDGYGRWCSENERIGSRTASDRMDIGNFRYHEKI